MNKLKIEDSDCNWVEALKRNTEDNWREFILIFCISYVLVILILVILREF